MTTGGSSRALLPPCRVSAGRGAGGVIQGSACGVGAHAGLAAGSLVVVAVAGTADQEGEQRQGGGYGERDQGCGVHGRGLLRFSCWVVSGLGLYRVVMVRAVVAA